MGNIQLYLTIILLFIEVIAFAWLIIDNIKSKKKQEEIIKLEYEIIKLERQILKLEQAIIISENKILEEIGSLNQKLKKDI